LGLRGLGFLVVRSELGMILFYGGILELQPLLRVG
jgi:hypothetical protein